MGQEALCTARFGDRESSGKALLETDALLFRGDFRLAVPLKEVQTVAAEGGWLRVVFSGGEVSLDLGRQAETWAQKIRSPKGRLDKLGVRPGDRVALLHIQDEAFRHELGQRTNAVADACLGKDCASIFLGVENKKELERVAATAGDLGCQAALWIVYPKGQKTITETDVLAAGRAAGLTDTKVVRFSDSHTALKFVIPAARRGQTTAAPRPKKSRSSHPENKKKRDKF
jgi:hypothetical protein